MSERALREQPEVPVASLTLEDWRRRTVVGQCCNCRCEIRLTEGELEGFFHDGPWLRVYFVCKECNDRIGTNGWQWAFRYFQRLLGATRRRAVLYVYSRGVPNPPDLGGAEAIAVHTRYRRSFLYPPPWMSGEYAAPLSEDVLGISGPLSGPSDSP
jgi:hypothetical protein